MERKKFIVNIAGLHFGKYSKDTSDLLMGNYDFDIAEQQKSGFPSTDGTVNTRKRSFTVATVNSNKSVLQWTLSTRQLVHIQHFMTK